MITLRPGEARGRTENDWLDSFHSFSFGDYQDPKNMGFRTLRVINEDWVQPGRGFAAHSHRDMEILTYVLEGALEHHDSMGNHFVIEKGQMQRMSAGIGVTHSEANPSKERKVHFLQIWILPEKKGLFPSYEQKLFSEEVVTNNLYLAAAGDGGVDVMKIHQDVRVYVCVLDEGKEVTFPVRPGRCAWVQVTRGFIVLNYQEMGAGDGASATDESALVFTSRKLSQFLLFDLVQPGVK